MLYKGYSEATQSTTTHDRFFYFPGGLLQLLVNHPRLRISISGPKIANHAYWTSSHSQNLCYDLNRCGEGLFVNSQNLRKLFAAVNPRMPTHAADYATPAYVR